MSKSYPHRMIFMGMFKPVSKSYPHCMIFVGIPVIFGKAIRVTRVTRVAIPNSSSYILCYCNTHAHLRHLHAYYCISGVTRAVRDYYSGYSCYWDSPLENALRVTRVGMPNSFTRVTVMRILRITVTGEMRSTALLGTNFPQ